MEAPSCVRAGSWEEGEGGGGEGGGGGEKDIPSFSSSKCFDCLTFRQIQRVSPSLRRIHKRARVFPRVVAQVSLPPSSAGIVNCTQAHSSTPITASTTQELQPPSPLLFTAKSLLPVFVAWEQLIQNHPSVPLLSRWQIACMGSPGWGGVIEGTGRADPEKGFLQRTGI